MGGCGSRGSGVTAQAVVAQSSDKPPTLPIPSVPAVLGVPPSPHGCLPATEGLGRLDPSPAAFPVHKRVLSLFAVIHSNLSALSKGTNLVPNMTVTFMTVTDLAASWGVSQVPCDSGVPCSVPLPFTPADVYSPAPTLWQEGVATHPACPIIQNLWG